MKICLMLSVLLLGFACQTTTSNPAVVPAQAHQVVLQWQDSQTPAYYKVYRNSTGCKSSFNQIATKVKTKTYTDNLTSGKKYYYVVTAVGQNGLESAYSNCSTATLPVTSSLVVNGKFPELPGE